MAIAHKEIPIPGEGVFRGQITECKFVKRRSKDNVDRMLRFRLSWVVEWRGLTLGETKDGCLAYKWINPKIVGAEPELIWSPPKSRNGKYYHMNTHVTPDWYEMVRKKIASTEYPASLGVLAELYLEKASQMIDPRTINPDLPLEIDITDEEYPRSVISPEDFLQPKEEEI